MTTNDLNQERAQAFAGRMLNTLNQGAITLMTSIGHRVGLFDTMAALAPSSAAAIAQAAGLNERYVREWLGAMVTGRVVEYDPPSETYWLPREHALWLTRNGGRNLAVTAQWVPLLSASQDKIVAAFRNGGGLHYHDYPSFHDVMAEASAQGVVAGLIDVILPLVPGLVAALREGIDVLDLGCGQGRAIIAMARAFPNSRFTGYDFEESALAVAQNAAAAQGLTNLRLAMRDAAKLDEPSSYGLVCTFDAIHDQADPARVLANIYRALRPDGVYLMQDIRASSYLHKNLDHPIAPLLYTISTAHCMSVSLAQGGAGLGTVWGEELALAMLREAGFSEVAVKQLPNDIINSCYIAWKSRG
jgi:SAM-dependent methyltransferase